MSILNFVELFGGLAFFLYGMTLMSASLEKMTGGKLEKMLKKATDAPWKGFLVGTIITIAIQSSSATTVMLVGFVNSGIMELHQTISVIMGSDIGTTLTAWILSLTGINDKGSPALAMLKPENFSLVFAVIGILLAMVSKRQKRKDLGSILVGFAILMTGQKEAFRKYLLRDGDIHFTYRKANYTIRICDVRVYPQGYAAIAPFASELTGVNMIADIGNGTMNVLYIVNGNPLSGKMYTEKFGTYQCTLAIREAFMRKTRRELNDAIIDEILINGTADMAKDDLKLIKATAAAYVADIFRRLREHGYDENTMKLYLTGGGACLVKHFYKVNKDRVTFVDDICAAAKGYEYMADIQLRAADHA